MAWQELDIISGIERLGLLLRGAPRPIVIAVAGGSCSGKSVFAANLAAKLGIGVDNILEMDNYFKDLNDPTLPLNGAGQKLYDMPGSYHLLEILNHARLLLAGRDIRMPIYDKRLTRRIPDVGKIVRACPEVIVEGLFAIGLFKEVFGRQVISVFLEADPAVCLRRRIDRDAVNLDSEPGGIRRFFEERVLPCYFRFVEPQKNLADLIIRSG